MPRALVRRLVLPLTAVALTACSGQPAGTAAPTAGASVSSVPSGTAAPAPSSAARGSEPTAATPPTADAVQNAFEIAYSGDRATGDSGRLVVGVGETVSIRVTSSRADEVHLHGYDLAAPVSADLPAAISFTADIPGVFELELEELGAELATLQVQ